ncbi:hypothetical protein AVEN_59690-1 [Araneus ventricosus]|uniref:Uncharacterized protein n=1 Tax=Araneus ventricosus TaxID=182803 RepID=A0A4Y2BMM0_ARAVE|nr:hypothetical protein AVEN_59690-1 [Araneus ventricosus]
MPATITVAELVEWTWGKRVHRQIDRYNFKNGLFGLREDIAGQAVGQEGSRFKTRFHQISAEYVAPVVRQAISRSGSKRPPAGVVKNTPHWPGLPIKGVNKIEKKMVNSKTLVALLLVTCLLGTCLSVPHSDYGSMFGGGGGGGKHGGGSRIVEMLAAGLVAKMLSEMHGHQGCHHHGG